MSQQVNIQDTVSLIPSDSTGLSNLTTTTSYPTSNGYTDISSTSYARFTLSSGSTGYLYYTFPAPNIPTGATIDSITAQVKVRVNNTSSVTNTVAQLYTGTTAKGSSSTFASTSTSNVVTLTPGTWTLSELQNIRLRIGGTGSGNSNRYIYFYGATISINYTFQTTQYVLSATSDVTGATIAPAANTKYAGEQQIFRIDLGDNELEDVVLMDNDVDVTNNLVQTAEQATSGSLTFIPSSFDSINSSYDSIYNNNNPENGCTDHNSSTRLCAYSNKGNSAVSVAFYNFDCSSVPQNAIITSVSCIVKASCYSSGQYFSTKDLQLYVGTTTPKGSAVTVTGNGSTGANHTVNGGTNWTRAELDNLKIRFYIVRSDSSTDTSFSFFGATLTVNYEINPENPYYYTYTLSNMNADHILVLESAGAFIPPEEDPELTYYPITISSINAITDPKNGTTRVEAGSNQTITITPIDPQLTLALDNGVDITSQLQGGTPTNTYTITTQVSGASYGFNLNSSTGYYVSTNDGVAKSASVARINMDFESSCLVTIQYINYAEANYDYGMFGKLDTAVATDGLTANSSTSTSTPSDSTSNYQLAKCSNSSSAQTITYEVPAGTHFIDVKYGKDDATNSNNDSLQWKVLSIEATGTGGDYAYTLTNIQQNHNLIFIFGNVSYYYITSSGNDCKLYPDGQIVELAGDTYKITMIPDDPDATVTLSDNNVNVTSSLTYEEGVDKNNNKVVNYGYTLSNISAAHTLVFSCISDTTKLFVKLNNSWTQIAKVYVKQNGGWIEQSDLSIITNKNYVKKN